MIHFIAQMVFISHILSLTRILSYREKGNVKVGSTVYESFWNESWLLIIHHLLLPLVL